MGILHEILPDRRKVIMILVAYLGVMAAAAVVFSLYVDEASLRRVVQQSGSLGVLVYFCIEVVYVTFTPLMNTVILIASGYLFGGHVGYVLNFLATTAGLLLIVLLVKRYGRPLLQRVVSRHFYERFDRIVQKVGPITLLIVYVLPFTPDDELTYLVAAGPIGFKRFVLPVLLGTAAKAAYSYIGEGGTSGMLIATYARVGLLVVGLIAIGVQEYIINRRRATA